MKIQYVLLPIVLLSAAALTAITIDNQTSVAVEIKLYASGPQITGWDMIKLASGKKFTTNKNNFEIVLTHEKKNYLCSVNNASQKETYSIKVENKLPGVYSHNRQVGACIPK